MSNSKRLQKIYIFHSFIVDIDESTVLPITPSKFPEQHDSKGYKVIRPRETYNRANIHLPPISNYHSHQRNPYEYHDADANYHHSNYLHHSRSKPNKNQKDQLHLSLDHYHYHHRYRYDHNGKTYDPRWWYMPINSVHGPKSYRHIANHYVAPKWYELGSKY